jgi:hypothetical protein
VKDACLFRLRCRHSLKTPIFLTIDSFVWRGVLRRGAAAETVQPPRWPLRFAYVEIEFQLTVECQNTINPPMSPFAKKDIVLLFDEKPILISIKQASLDLCRDSTLSKMEVNDIEYCSASTNNCPDTQGCGKIEAVYA